MEDFLSILVVILIAVATTSRKNKKKKAKAPDSKGPASFSSSSEKGFSEMKEFIRDVGKTVLEMDDDDAFDGPAKMKSAKLKPKHTAAAKSVNIVAEPAKPAVRNPVRSREASIIEEGLGTPTISTQGRSLFADRGCIGGSIPHDSHEGDSKYPYGADEGTYRGDESSVYAGDIAHELQSMDLARLRRAVVVSEILGKPKALRRS